MRIPIVTLFFLLLAYVTLTVIQMPEVANDPGLGWRLLTGEWIATMGAVPTQDPFLASSSPRSWLADQWLSHLIFATIFRWGGGEKGMALLSAMETALFLLVFMGITWKTAFESSRSAILSAIAAYLALKLSTVHFIIRPVVFGFLFFSIVSHVAWRLARDFPEEGSGKRLVIRDTLVLIPLMILWANTHPSFGLGIILFALTVIGLLYDTIVIDRRPIPARWFLWPIVTLILMALSTLLNPHGARLFFHVGELVSNHFFMNLNVEWRPINFRAPDGELFLQSIVLLLAGAFVAPRPPSSRSFTQSFMIGFFLCATFFSVRFLPYYAIVAAPAFARSMKAILTFEPFMRLASYRRLGQLFTWIDRRERQAFPITVIVLFALISLPLWTATQYGTVFPYKGPFGPSRDLYPYDGVAALRSILSRERVSTGPIAVAASPNWGGFLAFEGKGQFQPVIDDRNSLLGVDAYRDYLSSTAIGGDTAGYLKRVNARFLLLRANENLAVYLRDTAKLRERWRGEVSALFELPGDAG